MVPLRLAVHHATLTLEDRADVRRRVTRLEHFHPRLTDCRVTITVPQRRHRTDRRLYRVRLVLSVPLGTLVIDRQPSQTLKTALDDAFQAARQRLQDHARRMQGTKKTHRAPALGRVVEWFPLSGYGYLETRDGGRFYFDARAVVGGAAEQLDVGTAVRFEAAEGERGPQASTVAVTRSRPWTRAREEALV
jgi:cold shock CspA family protein/ribosome-associated translation inhibitor RaiA